MERFYTAIKPTPSTTLKQALVSKLEDTQQRTDGVEIVATDPLDWGTKNKPQIIDGWFKVTYQYNNDKEPTNRRTQ